MKFLKKGEVTYLVAKRWENNPHMVHGFSTRLGGVSSGHCATLNLGFNRGDQVENVIENYKRMCNVLEVPLESLVLSKQVHETNIIKVSQDDCGNGVLTPNKWESVDGFYTKERGVTLVTHYADCVPLFFYAPKYDIIGLAHAGWRGTVNEIGKKMVDLWMEKEHIPASEIEVVIGPSIGPCHFEVDKDVAEAFKEKFANCISYDTEKQKYRINLWECNKQSLLSIGILEEHITLSGICTCCHDDIFFSHRKTQGKRGTLGAFMCLK